MRAIKKRSLELEPLESRALMSGTGMGMSSSMFAAAPAHVLHPTRNPLLPVSLQGTVVGFYRPVSPVVFASASLLRPFGPILAFAGAGNVFPLGPGTSAAGALVLPGSLRLGSILGSFRFTQPTIPVPVPGPGPIPLASAPAILVRPPSSVTIALLPSPVLDPPPLPTQSTVGPLAQQTFHLRFVIVSGTGMFRRATGHGTADLTLTPNPPPVGAPPTALIAPLPGGTFSLTLNLVVPPPTA